MPPGDSTDVEGGFLGELHDQLAVATQHREDLAPDPEPRRRAETGPSAHRRIGEQAGRKLLELLLRRTGLGTHGCCSPGHQASIAATISSGASSWM
jgi:hypothetical protein